jgi:hypothetical protein
VAGLAAGNDLNQAAKQIALVVQMVAGMKAHFIAPPLVAKLLIGFAVMAGLEP